MTRIKFMNTEIDNLTLYEVMLKIDELMKKIKMLMLLLQM